MKGISSFIITGLVLFATLPSTSNYKLNSYGFGSGGTSSSGTSNYSLEGISGEISNQSEATANYTSSPGYIQTQQANVPKITLSNPSNYYDKLKFVIDNQSNPTDALFAIQVDVNDATCNFSTGTIRYIQNDDTLGTSLVTADYQTYSAWGGASGQNMIGLAANTNYCVRAKATQGKFTESAYGPSSSVPTVGQSITYCLYTISCGSGNSVSFSGLVAGTPTIGSNNIGVDFATNADSGGNIYIYSNGKLQSSHVGSGTINSSAAGTSVNLGSGSVSSGYGAQVTSASSITIDPPYNGASNVVGSLSSTIQTLLTASAPVTSNGNQIQLQAKASSTTPAASDYGDTVTIIAAASF